MMTVSVVYFIVYNSIFGWNKLPINHSEEVCDYIFKSAIYLSWIFYFLPLLSVYEKWIERKL